MEQKEIIRTFSSQHKLSRLMMRVDKTLKILGTCVYLNTANFHTLNHLAILISIEKKLKLTISKYKNHESYKFAYEIYNKITNNSPMIIGELNKLRLFSLLYNNHNGYRFILKKSLRDDFKNAFPSCFETTSSEYDLITLLQHLGFIENKNNYKRNRYYNLKPLIQILSNIRYISLAVFIIFLSGMIYAYTFRNSVLMNSSSFCKA